MTSFIDLTGKKLGRLTVIKRVEDSKCGLTRFECLCECGRTKTIQGGNLRNGMIKSCGCLNGEKKYVRSFEDLTGQKFGRLMVIERASKVGDVKVRWKCICDCQKIKIVKACHLKNGYIKSCGCLKNELHLSNALGVKHARYSQYRNGAMQRGRSFSISFEEFLSLTSSPCYYCGKLPSRVAKTRTTIAHPTDIYIYNGIDRIDNNIGYDLFNCVPCCATCNHMKCNLTKEAFLGHVKTIVTHGSDIKVCKLSTYGEKGMKNEQLFRVYSLNEYSQKDRQGAAN